MSVKNRIKSLYYWMFADYRSILKKIFLLYLAWSLFFLVFIQSHLDANLDFFKSSFFYLLPSVLLSAFLGARAVKNDKINAKQAFILGFWNSVICFSLHPIYGYLTWPLRGLFSVFIPPYFFLSLIYYIPTGIALILSTAIVVVPMYILSGALSLFVGRIALQMGNKDDDRDTIENYFKMPWGLLGSFFYFLKGFFIPSFLFFFGIFFVEKIILLALVLLIVAIFYFFRLLFKGFRKNWPLFWGVLLSPINLVIIFTIAEYLDLVKLSS